VSAGPIRDILLDVEGTTSSIAFVHDVLFPYSRARLGPFLRAHADAPEVRAEIERARESLSDRGAPAATLDDVVAGLEGYVDADVKDTALKNLQGMIWKEGFESEAYRAHVYPDVPPALERWVQAGLRISIYSSGSVGAQKLFFGHTESGDLLPYLHAHFDTANAGPKKAAASYRAIAEALGRAPGAILFLSDVPAELDAAAEAGLRAGQLVRPGTAPGEGHPTFSDFDAVEAAFALTHTS
jgi:enolase-phosphatase E1